MIYFLTPDKNLYTAEYVKLHLIISSLLFGSRSRTFYTQRLYVFRKKYINSICIQNVF